MRIKCIIFVCLMLGVVGCKGPEGTQGPRGLDGLIGAGTRTVYQGTVTSNSFTVGVPEIVLSRMPSVSVYVNDAINGFPTLWGELGDIHSVPDTLSDPYMSFGAGAVGIANARGNQYKIIVII